MKIKTRADDEFCIRMVRAYEAGFYANEIAEASGANPHTVRQTIYRIKAEDMATGDDIGGSYIGPKGMPRPLSRESRNALREFLHG